MTDYDEAQKLKITLKKWETDFVKEHKRKPKKDDIECAPTEIQDTYKDYNRLKRKIQERIDNKSSSRDQDENCETLKENTNNPSPKLENKDKSPTDRSQAEELTSPDDIPVWGRQLDRKKGGKEHESKSDSGGKNSCNYLQKLSSKLFDVSKKIGNTKPAFRRSAPLVANKINSSSNVQEDGVKSDIYDYSNTTENFKIKNELFEKAASLAIKKQVPVEDDPEKVILPDKFKVRQKPKLPIFSKSPCDIEYDLNHEAVSNNKRYPPNDWDEVDNLKPFADESDKFSSGMTTQGQPSFQSGCHTDLIYHESQYEIKPSRRQQKHFKDSEEAMDTSFNSESENKTKIDTEITRQRQTVKGNVSKVKKTDKEDQAESISNNEVYNYHETDNVPILPKHGKRKAAEKSNEGPSKKRKIKVVENDEMDDNEGKTDEAADGLRRPKAPSRSKPAASSTSSDNFVKLNMKLKTYKRKGKRQMTGPQMRRFQWKQKMKARSQSYENKCFKCGQEGHWANKCSGGGKNKEEIDDKPPVLEEDFPTLKQASMMAKGVKLETKMKKQKDIEHLSTEPAKEEEEDFDDLDIEAGVVRNIREAIEAPPPMEPFLTEEEYSSSDIPSSVKKGLKKFGYERFRHGQQQAVLRMLSGKSTLVILSTGGGKSLTYQLPAILYAEKSTCFTLVISPLVSLMEDQITGLPPGVRGACLHTNMTKAQRESVMESVKEGKVHFLLVSPEAIAGGTMSVLTSASNLPPISFVCIDEAHCLSEWSHNFRPSYLRLTKVLRERFGVQCFLGLTATATQSTAADVAKHLGIDNLEKAVVRGPPVPKNLMLSVSRDELRDEALIGLLQGERFSQCESIIVYCTRRETTDRLATLIRTSLQDQKGENWTGDRTKRKGGKKQYNYWDAESYHAGLSPAARKRVQNAFMSGRLRVVVATVAFGMGLDKSNVRGVIHYNMPKSFESYVQEIGRAGRDGKESHCHVFLDPEGKDLSELRRHTYSNTVDYRTLKKFIQRVFEPCRCVEVNKRHKEAVQEKRAVDSTEANREDDDELFDDWDEDEDQKKGRICLGHERAIPIESFVSELDVKEEGIATLFCYLELHPDNSWKVENLTNVYSTCSIQCYGGPVVLQEIAKKCPPVAVAIAKAKKDGKTFAGKTSIDFPVVEISDCMGWDSGPVKRELKMLMWNLTGASGPKRTSVMVEFTDLAFHYRAPGDLSEDEIDDVIMSLHNRIQRQEKSELGNLRYLFDTLHSVSHKNYWMCTDDLDEKKNAKLKTILEDYFQEQTDYKAAIRDVHDEELSSYELNQVLSDIRQFINMYSNEHKLHGRAIARVFHGIGSPCFPATTWGRVRRFWRSHINVDFNLLIKLATKELIKMR